MGLAPEQIWQSRRRVPVNVHAEGFSPPERTNLPGWARLPSRRSRVTIQIGQASAADLVAPPDAAAGSIHGWPK